MQGIWAVAHKLTAIRGARPLCMLETRGVHRRCKLARAEVAVGYRGTVEDQVPDSMAGHRMLRARMRAL